MATTNANADRIPIPSHLPSHLPDQLHSAITSTLLSQKTPITNLQSTLTTSLLSSGWTEQLRRYVYDLVAEAEGNPQRYGNGDGERGERGERRERRVREEVLGRVLGAVGARASSEEGDEDDAPEVEGTGRGNTIGEKRDKEALQIPSEVVEAAVRTLREELERICVVVDGRGELLVR